VLPVGEGEQELGRVITVFSTKGGAGKSVVSVLLATVVAERGRRVLLLEGDQNRGSLHMVLGVRPASRFEAVVSGEASPMDLLTPVTDRLWLLPTASGAENVYAMGAIDKARLHHRLRSLSDRFDLVVVDASADLEGIVRASSIGASRLVVVVVPEPAAMVDTYAVMKIVHAQVPTLPIDVLVNRAKTDAEAQSVFDRLATACRQFLNYEPGNLGALPEDERIKDAVRIPGGLLTQTGDTNAMRELRRIVESKLVACEGPVASGV